MKKLIIMFGGVAMFFLISCNNDISTKNKEESTIEKATILPKNLAITDLNIDGMVCEGCQHLIQDEVSKINGVASCKVSLKDKKAHIEYDKTKLTDDDLIKSISNLEDGQYKASKGDGKEYKSATETEKESNNTTEESTVQTGLKSFEIPNLFTLLLDQL